MAYCVIQACLAMPRLAQLEPKEPLVWPKVSIVIPACNEEKDIKAAGRKMAGQDYPNLEIVMIDDRSTDATGVIIDQLTAENPAIKPVHITELPEGWLGKVHAMHCGVGRCTGEWMLFADADIHMKPETLKRALAYCHEHQLDHLTAFPEAWKTSLWLDASISVFIRQLFAVFRPWKARDVKSQAFAGIGAFNLVRREAFDKTPGFEWLRVEIADDMGLGLMMKRSGARSDVVNAVGLIGLYWFRTLKQGIHGAERTFATVARFSLTRTFLMAVAVGLLELSPFLLLVPLFYNRFRPAGYFGLAVFGMYITTAVVLNRWIAGGRLLRILTGPFIAPMQGVILIRSAILGRRRGGVVWRNVLYPT
ncbi:MAG: glycosyltransferase, partial [Sedimentisphaerales bacterium]|nr:glycosyltransferase [Sedimentisphaerales bacterium]